MTRVKSCIVLIFKLITKGETALLLVIPVFLSLVITALFYPGAMSYDTLHALRGARNGVTDSMWPPMVSYIWRIVDLVSLNPAVMHFTQVLLLIVSIFYILFLLTRKVFQTTVFLFVYLSVPAVLGTIAVIWKDVLMAAFFLAGFAVIIFARTVISKRIFVFLSGLALFLIFLGTCSRHNAVTGAVPLLFYLGFVLSSRFVKRPKYLWLTVILLSSLLTAVVFISKIQLDNYSLPGLTKMSTSNDVFLQTVRVLDVAGASLCLEKNLFSGITPNLTIDEIRSGYDPKHVNLSQGLLNKVPVDDRINSVWMNTATNHPICFFNNKFELTKYMIGADSGVQFLITHPYVDKNEYEYRFSESSIRDTAFAYISKASKLPILKPWFIYLMAIVSFIYLLRAKVYRAEYLTIFVSAVFYFYSLVLFGNAADARLPFYTTTALLMTIFLSISERKRK